MKLRTLLLTASFISTATVAGSLASAAYAGSAAVYVGYADGLRSGADFPNPFGLAETFIAGGNTYTITNLLANANDGPDAGAVMLLNTGASSISVTNLDVSHVGQSNADFQIWTGNGPLQLGSGITLAPGTGAIFSSTTNYNFDTSDFSSAAIQTGFNPDTNNCSTGSIAASLACTSTVGLVTFTLDGVTTSFSDTGHVLDTGGYDTALYLHIHTGGGGVPVENYNESLNWRPIGTTGVNNPGGTSGTPEPGIWALMLLGFGGLGAVLRRRRQGVFAV
jgi:hypothetical protein